MDTFENLNWDWFLDYGIWIVAAIVVGIIVFWALRHWVPGWITGAISKIIPEGENRNKATRTLSRLVLWGGGLVIIGVVILVILPLLGVDTAIATDALKDAGNTILSWMGGSGIRVVVILAIVYGVHLILKGLIPRIVREGVIRKGKRGPRIEEEVEQRAETLSQFLVNAAIIGLWVVAVFMILPEFGANIGPLLAGAGIIGIGIGFGAQGLVRDILGGLFIIMEDHFAKGDWVQIAGIVGEVEYLGLRRTQLRDLDGTCHVIPNGAIKIASNLTKDWGCVNLNISVGYGENLDRVIEVMNQVSSELSQEHYWKPLITEVPEVLYVNSLGDSGIEIKIWGKTKPLMQWAVMGELRKRLKSKFDEEGIEIPWPHIKLYVGETTPRIPPPQMANASESTQKPKRRRKRRKPLPNLSGPGQGSGGGDGGG